MKRHWLLFLVMLVGFSTRTWGSDSPTPSPTPYPTATPYPCSFAYGLTSPGKKQPSHQWAYASPVSIGLTGQLDRVHVYASGKEALVVGLYDAERKLMNAVTIQASREGWQEASFPATVKSGLYYLAQSGSAAQVNLVAGAGVSCFYDSSGIIGPNFQQTGNLPAGLPVYVTGCPPQRIQGLLLGAGDSILGGADRTGGGDDYMELVTKWLNQHYGPVEKQAIGAVAYDSSMMSAHIEFWLGKKAPRICVIGIGMNNLANVGNPGSVRTGGAPVTSCFKSALIYGQDIQDIVSSMKSHMPPDGIILIANMYRTQDYADAIYPGWKDYDRALRLYNEILDLVAEANGAKVIDLYSIMASNAAFRDAHNMHPNSAGHAAIAVQIEKAIVEAGMPPSTASPLPKEKK